MKSLLHIILVLSILVTHSAWAVSGLELDDILKQNYTLPADQHDDVADTCNHFCHGSSHLLGLFSVGTINFLANSGSYGSTLKIFNSSQSYQPPIPPPIS